MSDINKIMEAYLGMVSDQNAELDEACGKKNYKEGQEECPKCEGKGCDHCDNKGYHEVSEKKLDPVDDAENDKKFKDRKDKDIDNDGDVDSSDEYLHKRRKATDDAIDGGKKPAKESAQVDEVSAELAKAAFKSRAQRINDLEKEKEKETNKQGRAQIDKEIGSQDKKLARSHAKSGSDKPLNKSYNDAVKDKDQRSMTQKYNDYKKDGGKLPMDAWRKHQRESFELDLSQSFAEMWQQMQEALDPKKGATAPEKYDDHSSDHDKKVIAQHKKSDKKVEDQEEKSHDTVFKAAGKDMKQAPARSGADNLSNGDKTIVNPVKK